MKVSPWTVGIFGFFFCGIAINIFYLITAIDTHPGLIEENPWGKGIAYQQEIDAQKAFAEQGYTASVFQKEDVLGISLNKPVKAVRLISEPGEVKADLQKINDTDWAASFPLERPGINMLRFFINTGESEVLYKTRFTAK